MGTLVDRGLGARATAQGFTFKTLRIIIMVTMRAPCRVEGVVLGGRTDPGPLVLDPGRYTSCFTR
ncbi:MAG: hypothetical protein QOK05_2032 [Chloroflexota bacterium]|jgi:hypothetical protein|nr:hypothetical protein [Chloroflexota bacterium]